MRYIVSGDLTTDKIREILNNWSTTEKPLLEKKYKYFLGKQNILNKTYTDESKPCNKIVTNFCHQIVQQYLGFNIGVPVSYDVDDGILDFLKWNDVTEKDNLLLRNALIFGKSFELQYLDDEKQNRFDVIDTRNGIDVYGDELADDELKAFIRFYYTDNVGILKDNSFVCEVWDSEKVTKYVGSGDFDILTVSEEIPHNFKQVPVCVFSLNHEEQGIFEQIMSLQDAYNTLTSSEVDDWEAFVDAYMVLKGITADDEDIKDMKNNRVLIIDSDAEAEYLTKQVNDSQIQNMLTNIKDMVFKISNCPDFSDEKFMAQSGVALEYKLVGFNDVSKAIMNRMEKALRKRIELFTGIETLKGDTDWRDAKITFTQNLPANTLDTAQVINQLRGIISNRTLISLLPFVNDVDEELKQVEEEQKERMDTFGFQNPYPVIREDVEDGKEEDVLE